MLSFLISVLGVLKISRSVYFKYASLYDTTHYFDADNLRIAYYNMHFMFSYLQYAYSSLQFLSNIADNKVFSRLFERLETR